MKIKRLFGKWKGFYKLTCINGCGNFYCRVITDFCETCQYDIDDAIDI